jgi:DNA replication protein DnaC
MGYNKESFRRIRSSFEDKAERAREDARVRRQLLWREIPELKELDGELSSFGLRIMRSALDGKGGEGGIEALREQNARLRERRSALLAANGYPADYTEPQYECKNCLDTGYCGIKMCDCMRRALIADGIQRSGLSRLMQKQSFENFSMEYYKDSLDTMSKMRSNFKGLYDYAHTFSLGEGEKPSCNLLLLGATGLGKTHLSTSIARVVIERGYDVFYNSAVGMLSDFEYRRFGNGIAAEGADDTSRYIEADLLIVDDLGTEFSTQFTVSCIYNLINTRYNRGLSTVISTNLDPVQLSKQYDDRIYSRIVGSDYTVYFFEGKDYRLYGKR